jgi:hypothetical protein
MVTAYLTISGLMGDDLAIPLHSVYRPELPDTLALR